jgi:hypothetical protein
MGKLAKILALPAREKAIILSAWGLLPVAEVAVRLLPFGRTDRLFQRLGRFSPVRWAVGRRATPERLQQIVGMAARNHMTSMSCLRRSFVLRTLLQAGGHEATLRIGARRENGDLHAHAWVEYQGQPLGESPETIGRFAPLHPTPRQQ